MTLELTTLLLKDFAEDIPNHPSCPALIAKYNQGHGVVKIHGTGESEEVFGRIPGGIEDGVRSIR